MTQPVNPAPTPPPTLPAPAPVPQPPAPTGGPAPAPAPAPQPAPAPALPFQPQVQPQPLMPQLILPPNVQPQILQVPNAQPPGQPQQPATGADWYPENTPVEQMTETQQVAYWKAYARRHEDRYKQRADYDALKAKADQYDELAKATMTDHQRAVADAAAQARSAALIEASSPLVDEWVRAAAYGRMDQDRVNTLLAGMDRRQFIDQAGRVDAAKVTAYVHAVAGTPAAPPPVPPAPAPIPGVPGQPVTGQPAYPTPQPAQPAYPALIPGYQTQPVQQFAQPYAPPPPLGQPFPLPAAPAQAGMPGMPAPDFGQGQTPTARPQGLEAGKSAAAAWLARQGKTSGAVGAAAAQQ